MKSTEDQVRKEKKTPPFSMKSKKDKVSKETPICWSTKRTRKVLLNEE